MCGFECGPGDDGGWSGNKLCAGELPDNRLTDGLLPPRFGLTIIHDQIAKAQPPSGAKVQHTSIDGALIRNGCVAQRTESHSDRYTPDGIIDDFVPDEDLDGIGPCVVSGLEQDHRFVWLEPGVCSADADEPGSVESGNPILGRSARKDLTVGYAVFAEVGLELDSGKFRWGFTRKKSTTGRACGVRLKTSHGMSRSLYWCWPVGRQDNDRSNNQER